MQCEIYKKENRTVKQWSGGTTCQLAIYPQDGKYEERNFIWRLSTATVETEESDFTDLPDYNRVLMVLKGEVVLEYKGIRTAKLNTYEYDYFDGSYSTKSYGIITDYNLMTRKDHVGKMEKIDLTESYQQLPIKAKAVSRGFFVAEGYAVVSVNGESQMLQEGQQMVLYEEDNPPTIGIMGQGVLVYTCVTDKDSTGEEPVTFNDYASFPQEKPTTSSAGTCHDNRAVCETVEKPTTSSAGTCHDNRAVCETVEKPTTSSAGEESDSISEGETIEEYYKAQDASFKEDLKAAARISLTNFRGSRFLIKSLDDEWYDNELYNALYKMEKLCIPLLIYLIGIVLIGYSYTQHIGVTVAVAAVVIWTLLCIFVISPFIYYLALPKPIKSHIKMRDEMTEQEKGIETARRQENRRLQKILDRYENSGKRDTFGYEKKRTTQKKSKK